MPAAQGELAGEYLDGPDGEGMVRVPVTGQVIRAALSGLPAQARAGQPVRLALTVIPD